MKKTNLWFLEVSTFRGLVAKASHFYATLRCHHTRESLSVTEVMSKQQADHENKLVGWDLYEKGSKRKQFSTESDCIKAAKKMLRERDPTCLLVLGELSICEPQRPLMGPKDLVREVRHLYEANEMAYANEQYMDRVDRTDIAHVHAMWEAFIKKNIKPRRAPRPAKPARATKRKVG